ncbi:receptor-activated Ca2+-permeable cation channel [Auriculariales sp. MPI-PUGE-AT-0066]|nr:receptor-activated Ca2+-permeable cation channel [Auriculariales sp. MPI-PUGE-AT-0066]
MPLHGDAEALRPLLGQHIEHTPVFPLIHLIRKEIEQNVDAALTEEQFNAADINFTLMRPAASRLAALENMATIYALFVVRAWFNFQSEHDLPKAPLWESRATCAELLAIKVATRFAQHDAHKIDSHDRAVAHLKLVTALTKSWDPLAGATAAALDEIRHTVGDDDELTQPASALDAAISTKSKRFLSHALVQDVVEEIWNGKIEFTTLSTRAVLADNYKTRQVAFYDCWDGPVLNHYRLRVPKYGAILEFLNFVLLFASFLICISNRDFHEVTTWEIVFNVMAVAFLLEEYTAAQEHGLNIYMANIWNGFDTAIITDQGLANNDGAASELAFDILACEALILFPRMAFFAMSDNVVIIALQGMIKEFCFFIFLAAICFSGFLFTLWKLAAGTKTVGSIAWLMVQVSFGNTYLSFQQASDFHKTFGPTLMVLFAAMSNTLLVTILISILSNTYSRIDANATQEYLYQFAVSTMEGVKGDALFCYQPPFNLVAYVVLFPASYLVSPHTFHRLNVFLMRLTSFPILIVITVYERYLAQGRKFRQSSANMSRSLVGLLPKNVKYSALYEVVMGGQSTDLLEAIFDVEDVTFEEIRAPMNEEERLHLRSFPSREHGAVSRLLGEDEIDDDDQTISEPISPIAQQARRPLAGEGPFRPVSQISLVRTATSERGRSTSRPPVAPLRTPQINTTNLPSLATAAENGVTSPISRLFFGPRRPAAAAAAAATANAAANAANAAANAAALASAQLAAQSAESLAQKTEAATAKMEEVISGIQALEVHRIKDEMKELQERQARIENLLMMLTRGMRADSSLQSSSSVRR